MRTDTSAPPAPSVRRPRRFARRSPPPVAATLVGLLALVALVVPWSAGLDGEALGLFSALLAVAGGVVLAAALPVLAVSLVVSAFDAD